MALILLEQIEKANDIKKIDKEKLPELASEIRAFLIEKLILTWKLLKQPDRLFGIAFHIFACLIQSFHGNIGDFMIFLIALRRLSEHCLVTGHIKNIILYLEGWR